MQPDAKLPFKVPTPGRNAPVHDWCNWLAYQFADQARSGAGDVITPEQCTAMAQMFLEMGEKALRAHLALIKAGIDPDVPLTLGGNITILPQISAERARAATLSLFSQPSNPPTGGSAA